VDMYGGRPAGRLGFEAKRYKLRPLTSEGDSGGNAPCPSLLTRWPAIGRGEGEGSGAVFRSPRRGAAAHLARAVAFRRRSSLDRKTMRDHTTIWGLWILS